jgi:hypothetical protein
VAQVLFLARLAALFSFRLICGCFFFSLFLSCDFDIQRTSCTHINQDRIPSRRIINHIPTDKPTGICKWAAVFRRGEGSGIRGQESVVGRRRDPWGKPHPVDQLTPILLSETNVDQRTRRVPPQFRWNNCEFTYNGAVLGIPVTIGHRDLWSRSNPFSVNGILNVNAGDVLGFRASPWETSTPDYIAADITIETLSVVPLPGAVVLGALGLSVAGWRLKRKP